MAPRWRLFAGVTVIVLIVVLGLSQMTARELTGPEGTASGDPGTASGKEEPPILKGEAPAESATDSTGERDERAPPDRTYTRGDGAAPGASRSGPPETRTAAPGESDLLLSAALSQALVGGLLAGLACYAGIPPDALGIDAPREALLPGIALGIGLYAANEVGAALADRQGVGADESLRELLAPETRGEWTLLLLVVLPVVAGVEELLFRGALVGALAAGFPVSPWLLAVLSSVAFGLGHGLQGPGGVLVTGALGFVLAAAFIITGSLWVVILAHYIVNALEFLVHEGIGVDRGGS